MISTSVARNKVLALRADTIFRRASPAVKEFFLSRKPKKSPKSFSYQDSLSNVFQSESENLEMNFLLSTEVFSFQKVFTFQILAILKNKNLIPYIL